MQQFFPNAYLADQLIKHLSESGIDEDYILNAFKTNNAGWSFDPDTGTVTWQVYEVPVMRLTLSFPIVTPDMFGPFLGAIKGEDGLVEESYAQWQ